MLTTPQEKVAAPQEKVAGGLDITQQRGYNKSTMIQPIRNDILIKLDIEETYQGTNFFIHYKYQTLSETGTVVALGQKVKLVQPKDKVVMNSKAGTHFKYNGHKVVLVKETAILATLEEDEE